MSESHSEHIKASKPKVDSEEFKFLHMVLEAHEEFLDFLNYEEVEQFKDDRKAYRDVLKKEIERFILVRKKAEGEEQVTRLCEAMLNEMLGFGPAQPLLDEPSITDIFINAPDNIFIERRGRTEKTPICFLNDEHVVRLVQRIVSQTGKHLDLSKPYIDAQLPDGSRIHAIIPPIAIGHSKVTIRKHGFHSLPIDTLVEQGALSSSMAKLLQIAVRARLNIVVCGGTGSGKTTMMNALLASIRDGERVITMEDTPELVPPHQHVVQLLTRESNPEGRGGVTQDELMINALRMRPDRVILGELRGSEAFNLLHAMNTGQDGSMATLHANGSEEVMPRLMNMILMARYTLSPENIRQQVAGALDLVVHVARLIDGSRRVMTISQVSEDERAGVKMEKVFHFNIQKINTDQLVGNFVQSDTPPTVRILNKLITAGMKEEYLEILKQVQTNT